ncbi:hypothetical protein GCM10008941_04960 [Rhizomicrobium palustre]
MQFNDKWLVGVAELDSQHEILLATINKLYGIALRREAIAALDGLVDDLASYVDLHCAYEEKLFTEADYPGAVRHKGEHDKLRRHIAQFAARPDKDLCLALDLLHVLKQWLTDHIMREDKAACAYLNTRGNF